MNRRGFLKFCAVGLVAAKLAIPCFTLPKPVEPEGDYLTVQTLRRAVAMLKGVSVQPAGAYYYAVVHPVYFEALNGLR